MTDAETESLVATMRSVTVYLDLKTRRSRALPAAIREAARIHEVSESSGDST
jgi:acyl-CoA thioesterase FadM